MHVIVYDDSNLLWKHMFEYSWMEYLVSTFMEYFAEKPWRLWVAIFCRRGIGIELTNLGRYIRTNLVLVFHKDGLELNAGLNVSKRYIDINILYVP